jgi:hypothetical protein
VRQREGRSERWARACNVIEEITMGPFKARATETILNKNNSRLSSSKCSFSD